MTCPEDIPGQMDVYECLEEASRDGHGQPSDKPATPRPMTVAELVAQKLKEKQ